MFSRVCKAMLERKLIDLNYKQLEQENLDVVGRNKCWVLATSADKRVTACSMSIVKAVSELYIYERRAVREYDYGEQ
ncbi:MAG: pyridoxamine 5-phosphate oxidase-related FMN-binding protein [Firmicutes bacterium]|nr:pyridoxamine 5-phosphate oxidase-related FMN-binding protein [Bacillota bacterium]